MYTCSRQVDECSLPIQDKIAVQLVPECRPEQYSIPTLKRFKIKKINKTRVFRGTPLPPACAGQHINR